MPAYGRVSVRVAQANDDEALFSLDQQTWTTTVSPAPLPARKEFFTESRLPEDHIVAEVEGSLAGYIGLHHPTPLLSNRHVLSITGLAVEPLLRRHGVGRALVEAAVAEARRRGTRKLSLRVLAHNAAARRLYEAAGFVVEGILSDEFLLDDRYVDDVLMARHLARDVAH